MKLAAAILCAVWMTHYSYHWMAADPYEAMSLFYIARGYEGTFLFAVVAFFLRKNPLAVGACVWGALEEVQTAICQTIGVSYNVPVDSGLCLEIFGYGPYAAVGSASLVYLLTRKRHDSNPR